MAGKTGARAKAATKTGSKAGTNTGTKAGAKAGAMAAARSPVAPGADAAPPRKPVKVPFPKKNKAPTETEFAARLPAAVGKRFDGVRSFLKKQKRVVEELYYYGPKTGWAYRYLRDGHSVATVMIHDERLLGIVSLDQSAVSVVDWGGLSPIGRRARQAAHGSPALLWLDLPLEGTGAADFKALLKAKLRGLPPPPPPAPRPPTSGAPHENQEESDN
jgi:hypothetical protein